MRLRLVFGVFALGLLGLGCTKSNFNIGSVGETMAYDRTLIEAKAGSTITVTLKNNATSAAMKHNFVLVRPGQDIIVGQQAMNAGEAKDWIPENVGNAILAHSKLSQPGSSVSVTFTVPPPGEYPYICTYPGHFATM